MAVVLETTLGDITIDLYINERPKACLNFLKLCKVKYYNFNLFHTINQGFIAQTGDPTGSRIGGESIWGVMEGPLKRYFEMENTPRIKHTSTGLVSFVGDNNLIGSQFFITLGPDLTYLDSQHCVFGEVTEGFDILRLLNEAICDTDHRPYQDIRITHTVVLEDPFPDPEKIKIPDASPEPTAERLQGGRIAPDEAIDETEGKSAREVVEIIAEKEAKARATILEMIGDIPDADMAPPENVLFVCKLNPVTTDDDLEIIFSRFGKIKSCEVIRDKKTGDSLQYAFVEFEEQKSCEDAYFKMDNVLIDDRRIHVDFSQSVAKIKWHGKGRGVTHFNDRGEKLKDGPENKSRQQNYPKNWRNNDNSRRSRSTDNQRSKQEENDQRRRKDRSFSSEERNTEKYKKYSGKEDYRRTSDKRNRYYEEERRRRTRSRSRSRDNQRSRHEVYQQRGTNSRGFRNKNKNFEVERKGWMKSRFRTRSGNNQRFKREECQQRRQNNQNLRFRNNYRSPEDRKQEYRNKNYRRINENDLRSRETQRQKRKEYENKDKNYEKIRRKNETEQKYNRKYEQERRRKYEEESSQEEKKIEKKKKRKKSSSDDSSSEDSTPKKSVKYKKKKKYSSESSSDSDSESNHKKSKKKKKAKKDVSSSSDSESSSEVPIKKKSKKY